MVEKRKKNKRCWEFERQRKKKERGIRTCNFMKGDRNGKINKSGNYKGGERKK